MDPGSRHFLFLAGMTEERNGSRLVTPWRDSLMAGLDPASFAGDDERLCGVQLFSFEISIIGAWNLFEFSMLVIWDFEF